MKTIEKIIWDQTFSVGVERIDEQHKKLIGMINTMIEAQDADDGGEVVSTVLNNMQQYATEHFSMEEECMINCGYADYDQHKAEHTGFKRRIAMLCVEAMKHRKAVGTEMLEFLTPWWTRHILECDMQYKALFNSMELK